jgi:hypothetical protein
MFASRALLLPLTWSLAAACGTEHAPEPEPLIDDDAGRSKDAGVTHDAHAESDTDAGSDEAFEPSPTCGFVSGKLDLLFVIDNSGSMEEEQKLLARELPKMVRALASGDVNGDGKQDHPAADLHVGVVSTDMGLSGGTEVPDCSRFGDDGLLRSLPACAPSPEGYLAYSPDGERSTDAFSAELGCQIQLGSTGCGFEQQLEAALKALAQGSGALTFTQGTLGHGDGPNAGFQRDDAILAIVLVTDEDDCSYPETSAALASTRPDSAYKDTPVNYRCQALPELLYPITRYTENLPKLRGGVPGSVVFGIIAGVPPELTDGQHDIQAMLADERMQFEMVEGIGAPKAACELTRDLDGESEIVAATPARRLLEVAQAFGEHAVVASICEDTFERPVAAIAKRIGGVLACPSDPVIF